MKKRSKIWIGMFAVSMTAMMFSSAGIVPQTMETVEAAEVEKVVR